MLGRKDGVNLASVETVVGKNTTIIGEIRGKGTIRVDGSFEGKIASEGDIVIGEGGKVKGDIQAANVLAAGMVEGNVNASGKLEVTKNATITGDLCVGNLSVEEGAKLQGKFCMQSSGGSQPIKEAINTAMTTE